jgi:hypothetical protein
MPASGDAGESWRSTRVAQQLGIDYPIIQAPFGGLPSQRLTATVSDLGGLGSLGAVTLGSSAISEVIGEIRSLTSKPFAINLWVSTSDREASQVGLGVVEERIRALARYYAELGIEPPSKVEAKPQDFETQVRAVIDAGVPVLSFIYGIPPSEILDECRRQRIQDHRHRNYTRRSLRTRASRLRVHCGIQFRRGWPPWVISSLSCGVAHGRICAHSADSGHCQTSRDSRRAGSQMGEALRLHSRWAPKACRSEQLFSLVQVLVPAKHTEPLFHCSPQTERTLRTLSRDDWREESRIG